MEKRIWLFTPKESFLQNAYDAQMQKDAENKKQAAYFQLSTSNRQRLQASARTDDHGMLHASRWTLCLTAGISPTQCLPILHNEITACNNDLCPILNLVSSLILTLRIRGSARVQNFQLGQGRVVDLEVSEMFACSGSGTLCAVYETSHAGSTFVQERVCGSGMCG
jgi:uncharacterized protein (DUF2237 family)